jgi:hypothetical protein
MSLRLAGAKDSQAFSQKTKYRAGGLIQVAEHLLYKHEALNSNPSPTKKIIIIMTF